MNRCLVTGCAGFIGSVLAARLAGDGHSVTGLVRRRPGARAPRGADVVEADLCDRAAIEAAVRGPAPQWVFHLAAQDNISASWADPDETIRTNVGGTLNLLQALHAQAWESPPVVVVVGSSAEYGQTAPEEVPIREGRELRPSSPYGVSKVAADLLARVFGVRYGLPIVRVRPFYITGPGKDDACAGFARQLLALEPTGGGTIMAGNLNAVRDLVDVRDTADALVVLASKGTAGAVYNLCSGVGRTMRQVLNLLIEASGLSVEVTIDPARVRPNDDEHLIGDNSRLLALGWQPRIPASQTMKDVLEYCRYVPV
jgi:GDP-4-dehydro-6-deoxy-D-mannose reductase